MRLKARYPDKTLDLQLLIDIKTDAHATMTVLAKVLDAIPVYGALGKYDS